MGADLTKELQAVARRGGAAHDVVVAAVRRWMAGQPLDQHEARLVEVVVDTNWASQLGRLILP